VDEPAPVVEAPVEAVVDPAPPAEPEPAPPVQEAPPAPVNGSHTIVSGDTLSAIAARYGITTEALMAANGLDWSSIIYTGHTLVIPGVSTPAVSVASSVAGLTEEMAHNAAIIIAVGRELGVSDYGIVIALATAAQESTLRNLDWGDRDSVGLFQQRPSTGWGSVEQLTDPYHAARLFYGGPSNPNAGWTRGLLDIGGWESMPLTVAAQSVQISAFPDAYAKWEASAWEWLAALG
jgi:LysM repeat protein